MNDQFVDDTDNVLARWRAEEDGAGELRRPPMAIGLRNERMAIPPVGGSSHDIRHPSLLSATHPGAKNLLRLTEALQWGVDWARVALREMLGEIRIFTSLVRVSRLFARFFNGGRTSCGDVGR